MAGLPVFSQELADFAANALDKIRSSKPLVQHLTNYVVMNETANVTLQVGARPVMAHENAEITELANALVINMGTLDAAWVDAFHRIGKVSSEKGIPIVFDPVGAGATKYRTSVAQSLLENLKITVVKGNPGEIGALAGAKVVVSGVDSIKGPENTHELVKDFAKKRKFVVALTGKRDILSDGTTVLEVHNNHQYLQNLTGTGCSSAAVIGAFLAVEPNEPLKATASALAYYCHAAEIAGARSQSAGPGKFREELLNVLYGLTPEELKSNAKIVIWKERN